MNHTSEPYLRLVATRRIAQCLRFWFVFFNYFYYKSYVLQACKFVLSISTLPFILFVGSDAYELVFHHLSRAAIACAWKLRCKLQVQRMYAILQITCARGAPHTLRTQKPSRSCLTLSFPHHAISDKKTNN